MLWPCKTPTTVTGCRGLVVWSVVMVCFYRCHDMMISNEAMTKNQRYLEQYQRDAYVVRFSFVVRALMPLGRREVRRGRKPFQIYYLYNGMSSISLCIQRLFPCSNGTIFGIFAHGLSTESLLYRPYSMMSSSLA